MDRIGRRAVAVTSATLLLATAACGSDDGAGSDSGEGTATSGTVTIGVSGSFSGATAFYGQEAQKGAELAVAELNEAGGDVEYKIVTADDECTPEGGASAYSSLINVEKVDVILGSACSGSTLSGIATLPRAEVPNLVVSSTNAQITEQAGEGGNEFVWRMNIDDAAMADGYSAYIADQSVTKLASLAVNNDYGRGAIDAYRDRLTENGIELVAEEYYTQGAGDFRSSLTKIASSDAEGMLVVGAYGDAVVMMRQRRELGLDLPVFARGDVVSAGFLELAEDPTLGEGIVEATNWDPTYELYPELAEAYTAEYGDSPKSYSVQAYLGVQVIAQAVEAGGVGREGIQAGMADVDWDSPIGPIQFDDHHQAHHDLFINTFVDGKIEVLDQLPTAS